jgi:hypothetical protein
MPKVLHSLSLTLFTILLSSCSPKTSENPSEVYQLWAGEKPSKNLKVLHGKYWQSGHFTKEYIMFMELRAPNDWIQEFIVQNKLKPATEPIALPSDTPLWFKPTSAYKIWEPSDFSQGSAYYVDSLNGQIMIYEIEL